MVRVGGLTHKYYKETKGLKTSGGQRVKAGTVLTREGHRWKPGANVTGTSSLTAAIDGEVYFTRKKNRYRRVQTLINIRPVEAAKPKRQATKKAAAKKTEEAKA